MTQNWIDAACLDDIPEGDVVGVKVNGKEIALYEVEGEIYATDNLWALVQTCSSARMTAFA